MTNRNWIFHLPTRIVFGLQTTASLPELPEIAGHGVVVVTDPVVIKLPPTASMLRRLKPVAVFDRVRPNPTVANVDELTELLRQERADAVVAVGGGSALDCAKAASCLAVTRETSIRPYHSGGKVFSVPGLPLVALPTTAGTGSEVTSIAVLEDEETCFKGPANSPFFYPTVAVVDPEWTFSVPIYVTACTALDALSHTIEGYWSRHHQPICDILAKEAAKTIFTALPRVYDDPNDAEAREAMSYAATLAGMAFQLPKNAIIHACSYPLSARAHMAHGAACAFTMEAAIRFNAPAMDGRMEEFAAYCGFDSIGSMTGTITGLKRRGGLPCTLREAGIDKEMVEILVRESFHPLMNNNPKTVTENDLRKIYSELDIEP